MTDPSLFDPRLFVGAISTAEVLEAVMLICFGLAWPAANLRMLRTRRATGKGLAFTGLILTGYVSGAASKLMLVSHGHALAPVFWLYVLNTLSVTANLALQWHYRPNRPRHSAGNELNTRSALLALVLAVGLWTPTSARTQTPWVASHAADARTAPTPGFATSGDRRFATAYGRFVRLADRGDANAAGAALFMFRNGKTLFGSEWSATEGQQVRWNALALNAARYQLAVLPHHAGD